MHQRQSPRMQVRGWWTWCS